MQTTLPAASPPLLRRLNSALVLDLIRSRGPLSRTDLAALAGLSKPTVNEVVELLKAAGYVSESAAAPGGGPRRPGRPARLLRFRADLGHVLGIDIGADKVLALVSDLSGSIVGSHRRATGGDGRPRRAALLRDVRAAAAAALRAGSVKRDSLTSVGVGTPGVVDPTSGRVTLAPQIEGWEGIELAREIGRSFPCPVVVDNEVHLSLLAERWRGAARGVDNAFYVQLGVGIGGGILIGGELYRGADGAAGEIGYLPFGGDEDASKLGPGPFERSAGAHGFASLGRAAASGADGALLSELAGGDPGAVTAETVFAAARRADPAAARVVSTLVERIARGVAAGVAVLNPEAVIVGGGISQAGPALLEPLERRVRELVPLPPPLVASALADEATALGAVRAAIEVADERLFAFR